jgi:hypothetical protein
MPTECIPDLFGFEPVLAQLLVLTMLLDEVADALGVERGN